MFRQRRREQWNRQGIYFEDGVTTHIPQHTVSEGHSMPSPDLSNRDCIVTVGFLGWIVKRHGIHRPRINKDPSRVVNHCITSLFPHITWLAIHFFHFYFISVFPLYVYVNFSTQRPDCSCLKQMYKSFYLILYTLNSQLQLQLSISVLRIGWGTH